MTAQGPSQRDKWRALGTYWYWLTHDPPQGHAHTSCLPYSLQPQEPVHRVPKRNGPFSVVLDCSFFSLSLSPP